MSGIYIPGMEMPTSCGNCGWYSFIEEVCRVNRRDIPTTDNVYMERHKSCPLVPVPPHGRLIDADAMSEKDNNDFSVSIETAVGFAAKQLMIMAHAQLQEAIEIQPTIIPAEEGE